MADNQPGVINDDVRAVTGLDRLLHTPSRTVIAAILYAVESADFLYLLRETELTKGNLSAHLSKLENAGYVQIDKTFEGKIPRTICRLTDEGREAFREYRDQLKRAVDSMPD